MKGSWNIKINLVKFHIEGLFGTQPQSATLNLWQTLGAQNRRHNCGKRMCRKGTIVSCGCLSYLVNQTAQYFCGSATESGVTKFGCKPNTPRLTNQTHEINSSKACSWEIRSILFDKFNSSGPITLNYPREHKNRTLNNREAALFFYYHCEKSYEKEG